MSTVKRRISQKDLYHLQTTEEKDGISIYYYARAHELTIKFNTDGFELGSDSTRVIVTRNAEDNAKMIQFMEDNGVKPF